MRTELENELISSLIETIQYIDKIDKEIGKSPLTFYSTAKTLLMDLALDKGPEWVTPEIIVTPRIMNQGNFHACVKDKPGVWGSGSTEKEAHPEAFK